MKKPAKFKVKKIKGTEACYGVYSPAGELIYESDRSDCMSYAAGLNGGK